MRALVFLLACAALMSLAGCAGYHLGPVNASVEPGRSIEIIPFNNRTFEPRLGDAVTRALRERIQTDGTYRLTTSGDGDIVVTGVITRYNHEALSYLNTDVATVGNYRVDVTARVTVRERSSGNLLWEKNVSGYTLIHVGTDLADAERQAMPLLAEDLARNTAELLTEGAW